MAVNDSVTQNLLPVQAYFNLDGSFNTFIGQGQPFFATVNPVQSGLTITNSTIDSSPIGATTPSTGVFTNVSATTGQISTTPSNNTDIANKFYVDTVAQGLGPKAACAVATLANITLSGLQTIDGYTTLAGDRVLVKNQSSSQYNGIYIASASSWTRAVDMDVWAEVPGAYTVVLNGSQSDTGWVCTATQTGTINVTAMPWVQFSGSATYFAGTGLTLASNTFSITNTGVSANTYGSASAVPVIAVNAQGQITSATTTPIAIANTQVSGLGTMSTQNANNVAITGGSITGTPISGSTVGGTTITASTQFSGPGTGLTGTASGLSIGGNAATATSATTAGSVTNSITFNNSGSGAASGTTFNGSSAQTISYNTVGASPLAGSTSLVTLGTVTTGVWNATPITNSYLANSSITIGSTSISLGSTASTLTSVTMATPTISSYETYTATSAPSYNAGRLWYDSNVNSLAYYNDVTNNTLHIGEEVQLKVYNNTGSTINIGQPVYITSTSSGYTYPNVALAIANSLTTGNVIGLANQAIPTGTAGYVTTIGLIQGVNTGSYTVGDTLYLSPYSAGYYQNTIPPTGYAIKIGTVAYVNSTTGAIYVNKSNLSVQAGNIVGQVALSNGGTGANLTAVAGGIVYSGASALAVSAAGTTGQVLTSGGTGAPTWSTPTAYATVTDDTTTNSTRYPLFANQTSGNLSTEYTSSTKLQYNPSTGIFTATGFSGSGASLTSLTAGNLSGTIPSGVLGNSSLYIGTTAVPLNSASGSITSLAVNISGSASSATTATTATNATNIAITDNTSSASTYYPVLSLNSSGNNAATTSSTKLSFVPNTGVLSATSFSGAGTGLTGTASSLSIGGNAATATSATSATTATNANNVAVADASTNANYYPTFVAATGSNQALKTASSTLKYNPSTGALSTGSVIYIAP